jgi:hypothetical protein
MTTGIGPAGDARRRASRAFSAPPPDLLRDALVEELEAHALAEGLVAGLDDAVATRDDRGDEAQPRAVVAHQLAPRVGYEDDLAPLAVPDHDLRHLVTQGASAFVAGAQELALGLDGHGLRGDLQGVTAGVAPHAAELRDTGRHPLSAPWPQRPSRRRSTGSARSPRRYARGRCARRC